MSGYYAPDGREIDVMEWAKIHSSEQIVKQESVGYLWVSTVYLGINHNWGDGPPLIFETMIFNGPDEQQWRYTTREQALAGHEEAVKRARFQLSCAFSDTDGAA